MSKKCCKVLLALLIAICTGSGLFAANESNTLQFKLFPENPDDIKIFDSQGILFRDSAAISTIDNGWIIQTRDYSAELTLPLGAIRLGPHTLIAIDSLRPEEIAVFLLRGRVRVVSDTNIATLKLSTPTSSYTFQEGDFVLISENGDSFYVNEGSVKAHNNISKEDYTLTADHVLTTLGAKGTVSASDTELQKTISSSLPIDHYNRTILLAETPEPAEQTVTQDMIAEETTPVEPEPVITIEETPQVSSAADEPITIAAEEPENTAKEVELADTIELILPETVNTTPVASAADSAVESTAEPVDVVEDLSSPIKEPKEQILEAGIDVGVGLMHKFLGTEMPYIVSTVYPRFRWNDLDLGFRLSIAFNGNPLDLSNWYRPRGNLLWNFGGGAPYSFDLLTDIATDALSLIDYVTYGEEDDIFYLRIDDTTPLSFGHGTLLRELDPSIDAPYIRRAGFYQTLDTNYLDYELLIDDIAYARLYGARVAITPIPNLYPFSLGLFALADIDVSPTMIVMTPGIDLTFPIIINDTGTLDFITDAAVLMTYDGTTFAYDASFDASNGLQNFLVSAGFTGDSNGLTYTLLADYRRGNVEFNMFGTDYQWRRTDYLTPVLSDYSTNAATASLGTYGELSYESELISASLSYRLPFNADSFAPDLSQDRISADFSIGTDTIRGEVGFSQHGFIDSVMNSSFDLLTKETQLHGALTYEQGPAAVTARYTQIADYDADDYSVDGVIPVISIETTLNLGTVRNQAAQDALDVIPELSETPDMQQSAGPFHMAVAAGTMDAIDSDEYTAPYTTAALYPRLSIGSFDLGLQFSLATNGNPFSTSSWYYEAGNTPWDIGSTLLSTDFYSLRSSIIDILSLIDYIHLNTEDDLFFIRADDVSSLTLGHGTMISDLNTGIDKPFIDRTGFYTRLNTRVFDAEMVLNDLSNPQVLGVRLGISPIPDLYPFEIGLSGIMDLTFQDAANAGSSATQMLLVPGFDMTLPLIYTEKTEASFFSDINILMIVDEGFKLDSFYSGSLAFDSFYNYVATAGFDVDIDRFSMTSYVAYQRGNLIPNMFGNDYAWRREAVYDLFSTYSDGIDESRWVAYTAFNYQNGILDLQTFFSLDFDADFTIPWNLTSAADSPDALGIQARLHLDTIEASFGYVKRGLSYNLRPGNDFSLFDESTQLFAEASYSKDAFTIYGRLASNAEYDTTYSELPYLNNTDAVSGDIIPAFSVGTAITLF